MQARSSTLHFKDFSTLFFLPTFHAHKTWFELSRSMEFLKLCGYCAGIGLVFPFRVFDVISVIRSCDPVESRKL